MRLRLVAAPHLARLAAACANSAILLQVDGPRFRCLLREMVEDSVVLQAPGDWRDDLGMGPWGSIIVAGLDPAQQTQARPAFAHDHHQLERHGYVLHDGGFKPGARRLGVPVHDRAGRLVAVLGIGGTPWSLDDDALPVCVDHLQAAAAAIAADLAT